MRYFRAAFGFCVITAVFGIGTIVALGSMVMAHCVLSDAQIAAGETCTQPADLFYWPTLAAAVLAFGGIQWIFLRWALRKLP